MCVCIFYLQTATVCNSTSRKYVQFMHFLAALREHVLHGDKGRAFVQDYVRITSEGSTTQDLHCFVKIAT